jgi:hypothetical protein
MSAVFKRDVWLLAYFLLNLQRELSWILEDVVAVRSGLLLVQVWLHLLNHLIYSGLTGTYGTRVTETELL